MADEGVRVIDRGNGLAGRRPEGTCQRWGGYEGGVGEALGGLVTPLSLAAVLINTGQKQSAGCLIEQARLG